MAGGTAESVPRMGVMVTVIGRVVVGTPNRYRIGRHHDAAGDEQDREQ
jgi:hypothetical protein